jgi:ferritin-like protein
MAEGFHEPVQELSGDVRDFHRAVKSMIEEWEAVDWYNQRADRCSDPELKRIIEHNRDEEIEHAAMALEWLRRRYPVIDETLRTYLFTSGEITALEEEATGGGHGSPPAGGNAGEGAGGLGIGSLKS